MTKYRISSNGDEFRIEYLYETFWRGRQVWAPLKECRCGNAACSLNGYYPTYEDASNALQQHKVRENRVYGKWTRLAIKPGGR